MQVAAFVVGAESALLDVRGDEKLYRVDIAAQRACSELAVSCSQAPQLGLFFAHLTLAMLSSTAKLRSVPDSRADGAARVMVAGFWVAIVLGRADRTAPAHVADSRCRGPVLLFRLGRAESINMALRARTAKAAG